MRRFEFVTLGSGPVADPGPAGQIISLDLLGNTSSFPQKSKFGPVYTEAHEKCRRKKCRKREF